MKITSVMPLRREFGRAKFQSSRIKGNRRRRFTFESGLLSDDARKDFVLGSSVPVRSTIDRRNQERDSISSSRNIALGQKMF